MRIELLDILRCPESGQPLRLEEAAWRGGRIASGWLTTGDRRHRYPVRDFVPRFVPESNYADNFGMQWNKFRHTQLDSHTGVPVSTNRFWAATAWPREALRDQWVLDAGCGAGVSWKCRRGRVARSWRWTIQRGRCSAGATSNGSRTGGCGAG